MKVLALVSGGKDSCYNALLCERHGHTVVALGNLYPDDPDVEELDSYMYQTVGHTLIKAYSECTGLPLFRKRIVGTSVEQGLVYSGSRGDEVEDLALLLMYAKEQMPEITAVSSGAIASDYQRSRVEHVCARLGLVSLAYLWHQPQSLLLKRMIESHIDARLVKVAAAGLYPSKHLGASLADVSGHLHHLRDFYGIHVCGEGGEYETLTLDCPLFRCGRIVLDESEIVVAVEDSMAPVAWLKPISFHIEWKDGEQEGVSEIFEVPEEYSGEYIQQTLDDGGPEAGVRVEVEGGGELYDGAYGSCHGYCVKTSPDLRFEEDQICQAFAQLLSTMKEKIERMGFTLDHGVFCTLFVSDMAYFGHLNEVYAHFFPSVNPPSRATLELSGDSSMLMAVHVLCTNPRYQHAVERRVLHVQSMSEWAPSCIGPYSQATSYHGLVRFAGQIALDPPTLTLVKGGIEEEVARVSKTCSLVGAAMKLEFQSTMLWSILYISKDVVIDERSISTLEELFCRHDADERSDEHVEEYLSVTHPVVPCGVDLPMLPFVVVLQCPHLPRGAMVELQSINVGADILTYNPESDSSDGEDHCGETSNWYAGLEYATFDEPDCLEVHAMYCTQHILKVNMVHTSGGGTMSNPVGLEETLESIPQVMDSCLSMARLSVKNVAQVNCYINTSLSGYDGFEMLKDRVNQILKDMGCVQAFTIPTSGVWVASHLTRESSIFGIEVFAQK
ncbi:hypothetical protein M9435_005143 [Picochlorum sp. BPE23]|nr:hypothetical protein M9435_005143 [Picochlorum sp. BPE23]